MLDRIPTSVFRTSSDRRFATIALVVRLVAGVAMVGFGIGKFADYSAEVDAFRDFDVPLPGLSVLLAGAIETVGGVLVTIGLLARPAAALIAGNLLVALLTAGRTEGGFFHLAIGPTLTVAMIVIVVLGAGSPSVDQRIAARRGNR